MMKISYKIRFITFACLILSFGMNTGVALAQDKPDAAPPKEQIDPADLSLGWWKDVTSDKKNLKKTLDDLILRIKPYVDSLPEEKKGRADAIFKDIKLNFQSFLKNVDQPPPKEPPSTPIAESYTLDRLIELNNAYVKEAIELEGREDERADFRQMVENLQDRIDLVRQNYQAAEERSQEKVLLGLELVSLFPALDVAKAKLALIEQFINNDSLSLKYLKDEIEAAKERLVTNEVELRQLARQLDPKMELWVDAKNERQKIEASLADKYSEQPTEEAKILNQYLTLQQTAADLNEVAAHNRLIKAEILYTISKILNEPQDVDLDSLVLSLKDWSTQLAAFKPMVSEFETQTERALERSAQLISLDQSKPTLKDAEREILKKSVELGQKNLVFIQGLIKEIEETSFLYSVAKEKAVILQGEGLLWLRIVSNFIYDAVVSARRQMGTTLFHIGSHPVTPGAIFQFTLIMVITWWLAKFLNVTLKTFARRRKGIRKAVIYRVSTLFRYFILLVGLLIALTSIGFDFSNLVIIAGALGIGIGFGLQNIFNDFISGLIILFQSHLKVGDFVVLESGVRGEIREINVRSTVITTNEGVDVIVPNSMMVSSRIINWTLRDPYRRMHIPFGVAYGTDIDKVAKVVIEAAKKVPSTLDKIGIPEPQVFMTGFGNSALEMELVVWVNEKWTRRHRKTISMYLWTIEKVLKKNDITVPFPQRDLHIKTVLRKDELSDVLGVEPGQAVQSDSEDEIQRPPEIQ